VAKQVIDIEAFLRWVYADQCADRVAGGGIMDGGPQGYGSAFGRVAQMAALGCAVDASPTFGAGGHLHPDADAAHDVVTGLDAGARMLIVYYARTRGRPDAMVGVVPCETIVLNGKGNPKMRYDKNRHPIGPVVHVVPSWQEIANARAEYVVWRRGLVDVAQGLQKTGLRGHVVTGPDVALRPWD